MMAQNPVAISSNAKSRLNGFRYTNVENNAGNKATSTNTNLEHEEPQTGAGGESSQNSYSDQEKALPQTPFRIPLADLIGNTEDAFNRMTWKTSTPDDRVFWKYEPASTRPRYSNGSPMRRGQKRPRSSSPGSSPATGPASPQFSAGDRSTVLDIAQHDIAAELWTKYLGTSTVKPTNAANSRPLFLTSSPHTPAPPGRCKPLGFRRSTSCNAYWPSSTVPKKMKVDGNHRVTRVCDALAESKDSVLAPESSKTSRIKVLVDKIQETLLATPQEDNSAPSSSNPLPISDDTEDAVTRPESLHENVAETPSKIRRRTQPGNPMEYGGDQDGRQYIPARSMEMSSEFGDEELDKSLFDLLDEPSAVKDCNDMNTEDKPAMMTSENKHPHYPRNTCTMRSEPLRKPALVKNESKGFDEFDDDEFDDDEFDEGMEELMVKLETQTSGPPGMDNTTEALDSNMIDKKDNKSSLDMAGNDEFDLDDLDDIENALLKTVYENSSQVRKVPKTIQRYLILGVADGTYESFKGQIKPEKVLFVQEERTQQKRALVLRESWFDSPCTNGSYIHLIGDFDSTGQCIVDNSQNMIILHPDHLISATVVADSFSCQRRAVLQDRVKSTSDASRPQVYGNILHDIFQKAMSENCWNFGWLKNLVARVLENHVENLYEIQVDIPEATKYVMSKIPSLRTWADTFMRYRPSSESLMEDVRGSTSRMSVNKLLEVEEHIWSPMYGLKGNVDATVQVSLGDGADRRILTVPLELKTGKNNTNESHRAQTALYTLLMSDRYDIDVTFGILYYLEVGKTYRIRAIRGELLHMIQQRNSLAEYVRNKVDLPPMLKRSRLCNSCYAKIPCFTYHRLLENGNEETSGLGNKFTELIDHLTYSHQQFFTKWDVLLTIEEKEMMKFRRELWSMLSTEREAVGRCFSNVVVESESGWEDKNGPKINRFRYTFVKKQYEPGFSFTDSQITVGEPIVVSDQQGHFALANGYVVQISSKRITVAVDRRLHNSRMRTAEFSDDRNQSFTGIVEIIEERGQQKTIKAEKYDDTNVYRLDKDEFSNGMATVRNNLICLMDKNLPRARQLRDMIIDGAPPAFKPLSSSAVGIVSELHLNIDQKCAIEKVLSANDYALVLGMPGTGKTTTIAHIIRALVAEGKSVLLTSYTHTAVDNILLKIKNDGIRTLRLGATAKIHPEVQNFADLAATSLKTFGEIRERYESPQVVATTCLGTNHPIFNSRTFDYCIVDEASQITLPVCLGPIRMAKAFILVGDHYQLPPLVQNKEAQQGGLDVSLFKLLCDMQPASVVNLEHQYRMCEDIMVLSNNLIYSGHLKCGTQEVASQSLHIPDFKGLKKHHPDLSKPKIVSQHACFGSCQGRCWLRELIDPAAKARLVSTDSLVPQAVESANGSRIVNSIEVLVCVQLVEAFISVGIPAHDIGVVTLYRSQLALLKRSLFHRLPGLEMHTADRFQGRDKEIVIMSCVRSNPERNVGDLLRDWRRVNVAFTRARTKFLAVGSRTTLGEGNELLRRFVGLMDEHEWIYELPPHALEGHIFEEYEIGLTQSPVKALKHIPFLSPSKSQESTTPRKQHEIFQYTTQRQGRNGTTGQKQPQKIGGKLLDGGKVISKRPILRDVYNDAAS